MRDQVSAEIGQTSTEETTSEEGKTLSADSGNLGRIESSQTVMETEKTDPNRSEAVIKTKTKANSADQTDQETLTPQEISRGREVARTTEREPETGIERGAAEIVTKKRQRTGRRKEAGLEPEKTDTN